MFQRSPSDTSILFTRKFAALLEVTAEALVTQFVPVSFLSLWLTLSDLTYHPIFDF